MYLETLNIYNFRKYGTNTLPTGEVSPGLSISFQKGVNVLIGENDSGKTAIIDAIRYVLKTQSGEFIQVEEKDFYQNSSTKQRATLLKIECIFKGFSDNDAGHFLEWLGLQTTAEGTTEYELKVWLTAKLADNKVIQYIKAGMTTEGIYLEGEAKYLLRVVYLKPLRDALSDMTHGNKSRLAQILKAHPIFKVAKDEAGNRAKHELENKYLELKKKIDEYFDDATQPGHDISKELNELLSDHFLTSGDDRKAGVCLTANELQDILKQLDLILEPNKSGLGTLNLLCVAAEFLLYTENKIGLKLSLIEEMEAHLHPQYQLRLIDFVSKHGNYGQFILTTHSTTLASKIPLKNLILCKDQQVYPLGIGTMLEESDYAFLQRFLDATKSNMFFAQGLIIVEGDAENLLIPTIAEIIDRPLHKYGVSIVNVGSTAFKRYVKIFQRNDGKSLDMPISIISDLDIRSLEYYDGSQGREIPEVLIVNDDFINALKTITTQIDFNLMPDFFTGITHFKTFVKDHQPSRLHGGDSTREKLYSKYESAGKQILDNAIIEQLRSKRTNDIKSMWNNNKTQIYTPKRWTLEYDLACSSLFKELAQAIEIAKYEKQYPSTIITTKLFKDKKEVIDSTYTITTPTDNESFAIFKPLCDSKVSKAATAQYLSSILCDKKSDMQSVIKTDPYMKYIVDAICYVTEPLNDDSHE
ncbi:MAG: AAA family ATPase [Rikenellaceae bacterium]